MRTYFKDPGEKLDWVLDWSVWLSSETISTSTVTSDTGITVGDGANGANAPTNTTTAVTFWLFGGTDGQHYTVTNTVTTSAGRIGVRQIMVQVTVR